jgi:hypothetical protein
MSNRKTVKESHHKGNDEAGPMFLERFFQKKVVWLATVILLAPLVAWFVWTTSLDLFGIKDDPDFNTRDDILGLIGMLVMIVMCTYEYRDFQKRLWSKRTKEK